MLQARRPCQSILLRAVSRTGERAGSRGRLGCGRWVAGALLAVLGLAGCKLFIDETTESKYPKMSPEARAVKIYYSGEQPECLEVLRLEVRIHHRHILPVLACDLPLFLCLSTINESSAIRA